jgi:hypothetical protein
MFRSLVDLIFSQYPKEIVISACFSNDWLVRKRKIQNFKQCLHKIMDTYSSSNKSAQHLAHDDNAQGEFAYLVKLPGSAAGALLSSTISAEY